MKKKVLLVGGGGRENALAWKLKQSPEVEHLYIAPGNTGTAWLGDNISISATDTKSLLEFALDEWIDFTVVGPDDSLGSGIVNAFRTHDLRIFGPSKPAFKIESSKLFGKRIMVEEGIPTAFFSIPFTHDEATWMIEGHFSRSGTPLVVKADGLALGKGAYVCRDLSEARTAIYRLMVERLHGKAGDMVIIENFVNGQEVSIHAFSDGKTFKQFPSAQDHKTIFDGGKGPNTGGMGAYAPVPWFTSENEKFVAERVLAPALRGLGSRHTPFVGVLYPGLKITSDGPRVLEFNGRFGDPETQVYMRLLKSDLLQIMEACVDGRLHEMKVEWHPGFAVCVVMAAEGYPSANYKKGVSVEGTAEAEKLPGVVVFHAGMELGDGGLVTSGGRVLSVTAYADTLEEATARAYQGVECIHFDGMQFRKDIGGR